MRRRRWRRTRWPAGRGAAQRGLVGESRFATAVPETAVRMSSARRGCRLYREASATPPSARCTTTRSPLRFSTANGGRPTSRSTSGSLWSPPRAPPTTPPCGCTITGCSWCRPVCGGVGQVCGSALQPRPVPRIRNICAAAVATTTRPGDARSPSDRLSAAPWPQPTS